MSGRGCGSIPGLKSGAQKAAEPVMSVPLQNLIDMKKQKHYGGRVGRFSNGPHQFCIGELIPNDDMNVITLAVPLAEQERKTRPFTKIYENDADCAHLKLSPAEEVKNGLSMIARFFVNNRYIILRGIALGMDDKTQMVKVMLTDELKIHSIGREVLYHITPEFYKKPFLACPVELADIPNTMLFKKYLQRFIGENKSKEVSVEFVGDGEFFRKVIISLSKDGPRLREVLEKRILADARGKIPTKGQTEIGHICFAHSNGKIFMNMKDCIIDPLSDYLAEGYEQINKAGLDIALDTETMYLVPYQLDVCRVRIEKFKTPGTVSVRYIDYGNHAAVSQNLLIPAAMVDPFLEQIPPLCVPFQLKFIEKITDIPTFNEFFDTPFEIVIKEEGIEGKLPAVVLVDPTKDEMDDDYYLNKFMISSKIATMTK